MSQPSSSVRQTSSLNEAQIYAHDLGEYVQASPSSYHAVRAAQVKLEAAGFTQLREGQPWDGPLQGRYYVVRDGAFLALVIPAGVQHGAGYRILGAHTDSPGFKLKPKPSMYTQGWLQAGVEIYGGPLLNSWLDRDLRLAGRLAARAEDGSVREVLTATGPVARIPQLAIHLDHGANEGLTLDKQRHLQPVWGTGSPQDADVLALLADAAASTALGDGSADTEPGQTEPLGAVDPAQILGYEVVLADAQAPALIGRSGELLASGRLDNLTSVHAGLTAMIEKVAELEEAQQINVLAAFDHEEVGSATRSGAAGPFLEDVLVRVSAALGESVDDYRRSLARSLCLSSDAGHLVHPNYQGHHDPVNTPPTWAGATVKDQRPTALHHGCHGSSLVGRDLRTSGCAVPGVCLQ